VQPDGGATEKHVHAQGFTEGDYPGGGRAIFVIFAIAALCSPFLTVLYNQDPVMAGPRVISGLSVYDGLSMSVNLAIAFIPFFLGMRFLRGHIEHGFLLRSLAVAGILYAFLVLFEFRMSPRLHIWIYGFFQHNWVQHIRGGGFRPIVFLEHGLAVGLFLAIAVLAVSGQIRTAVRHRFPRGHWVLGMAWVALALLLSRNVGAVLLALFFSPVVLAAGVRKQLLVGLLVALTFLSFPFLRSVGLVPTQMLASVAEAIDERRAESLRFRFSQEEQLLDRAQEKPLAGWGGWGRNILYDPRTGRDLSVPDGAWIIVISMYGWVGYIAQFGLMALPLLLLWARSRSRPDCIHPPTATLAMVMALSLMYAIPNDFRNPVFWLVAGALAGCYQASLVEVRNRSSRRNVGHMKRASVRQPRPM
jgi:hypothetical protein